MRDSKSAGSSDSETEEEEAVSTVKEYVFVGRTVSAASARPATQAEPRKRPQVHEGKCTSVIPQITLCHF